MSKAKPVTPYQRLKATFCKFADEVQYRTEKLMWLYPKAKLGTAWMLADLAERVAAADQLGFEVLLRNTDGDLRVIYRKKAPDRPWEAHHD